MTSRGTNVTIPLNKSAKVKDNDFIIFVNNADENEEKVVVEEVVKSNFGLNLNVTATDDANLKIILPNNLGTIEATGNGNVNMSTATSEDFKMFGNYTIKNGRFQLNLMDLVSRTFNLKSGGSLSWTGAMIPSPISTATAASRRQRPRSRIRPVLRLTAI